MAKTYFGAAMLFVLCISCGVSSRNTDVAQAFERRQSNVQVEGEGVVTRIMPDDNVGSPHQRFIVQLASKQTILIEHNTDVAPRIDHLQIGTAISFSGEYVWNEKGGLVHWTHHDPAGKHKAGWIKYGDRVYQ